MCAESCTMCQKSACGSCCWICHHEGRNHVGEHPIQFCACNMKCHKTCLLTWVMHNFDTEKEGRCTICNGVLPDLKDLIMPRGVWHHLYGRRLRVEIAHTDPHGTQNYILYNILYSPFHDYNNDSNVFGMSTDLMNNMTFRFKVPRTCVHVNITQPRISRLNDILFIIAYNNFMRKILD